MLVTNTRKQSHLLEILIHKGRGGEWDSVTLPPSKFEKYCYKRHGATSKVWAGRRGVLRWFTDCRGVCTWTGVLGWGRQKGDYGKNLAKGCEGVAQESGNDNEEKRTLGGRFQDLAIDCMGG